jgi:nitroimidazol reductase NimA-like FMN-containing flavoprotein (pyridoxamine 5'-phosphate oxidase superfamily)
MKLMRKYHMQKSERQITNPTIISEILINGKHAIIALCNNNEPYIVTLSYGFDEKKNCLYFHTAKQGLKLDFLKVNPVVCGTVIEDLGYKTNQCSHAYRSIVFWGILKIINELEEKKYALNILLNHLEKNPSNLKKKYLSNDEIFFNMSLLRLDIQEITGKASN